MDSKCKDCGHPYPDDQPVAHECGIREMARWRGIQEERERCLKIIADATKDEKPCSDTWSTLCALQVLIRDY